MSGAIEESLQGADWNVLTSPWLDVMTLDGEARIGSPLEALEQAGTIRCIALASPLDVFSAYRFLSALLYWKADKAGGVDQLRESLRGGGVPADVLEAIGASVDSFGLFHAKKPFLQDASLCGRTRAKGERKSAGSFFAEFASGTNIAHFHHGDDEATRLCLRCATIGMLRVVPWSQAGGAGVTPSVHGGAADRGARIGREPGDLARAESRSPCRARWCGDLDRHLCAVPWGRANSSISRPSPGTQGVSAFARLRARASVGNADDPEPR